MTITQTRDPETGVISRTYQRERWYEYLFFEVCWDYLDDVPEGYLVSSYWQNPMKATKMAVVVWFWHAFELAMLVKIAWWNAAKFFHRRDLLYVEPGQAVSWFWPIYLFPVSDKKVVK